MQLRLFICLLVAYRLSSFESYRISTAYGKKSDDLYREVRLSVLCWAEFGTWDLVRATVTWNVGDVQVPVGTDVLRCSRECLAMKG